MCINFIDLQTMMDVRPEHRKKEDHMFRLTGFRKTPLIIQGLGVEAANSKSEHAEKSPNPKLRIQGITTSGPKVCATKTSMLYIGPGGQTPLSVVVFRV